VQVLGFQQPGVRRHEVSGLQANDVPADQLRDRQFLFLPVANNGSGRGDLLPNLLHRVASLELHEEVQQHAEQDHRDDDESADPVAERECDGAGHEKDDDEGIGQEAEETHQPRIARLPYEAVGAVETRSPCRLIRSQAGRRRLEQFEQIPQRPVPIVV
jgi:hypothetical protein